MSATRTCGTARCRRSVPGPAPSGSSTRRQSCRLPRVREQAELGETGANLTLEIAGGRGGRTGQSTKDDVGVGRNVVDDAGTDMTKPAGDSMSNHRRPDSLAHDQPETRAVAVHHELGPIPLDRMYDEIAPTLPAPVADCLGEVRATAQAVRLRQHPELPLPGSGGEGGAALAATRRHDRATRTGAHPETEAVNARAAAIVRLERPLALGHGRHSSKFCDARRRQRSNIFGNRMTRTERGCAATQHGSVTAV